ncbi:NIPSNAP family protein [Luteolibacter luteus]|uniref:NIPSNAP family protein n=1 Tax=Luteolibacter luteus TaxID=2728835 RepID=A0A858RPL8_9BACT|nr:NIPSNAP family protein [Luteolibacter luteus]QJE98464.1 NIPSNAP family protein [Luteolibacter luteus]
MIKVLASAALAVGLSLSASAADKLLYELRTYHAEPGKLDALLTRFRDHTCKLFEKHGMTNVGYWVPVENKDNVLIYLLSYPDKAARDAAWKGFLSDEDWKKAAAASEVNGKLVGKIDELYLTSTDFSPGFPGPANSGADRVFEMRTYTTRDGLLPALHKRFNDHTIELFKKHGITNLGYFKLNEGQPDAANTLLYFLAHKDQDAATKSWTEFRADPVWVAAKKASEDANGGSLTVLPDGVKNVFLKPVDFSPVK